jgi:peroxiredoxin
MLRLASVIIVTLGISSVEAVEPFHVVLTDVERNISKETIQITRSDVTPDCPVSWSVRKYVLHGGKQEGVEVIEVNNGKLRFAVVPTRGMSVQKVSMGDLRLAPEKGLVHPKFISLDAREGSGWLESFSEWMVRCGLESFGGPETGEKATMKLTPRGKIGNTPASQVDVIVERQTPYRITVRGRVDEVSENGSKLEIWTQISTVPGANTFQASDKVTNRSDVEQEFSILYHSNYGAPLMGKGARFFGPARQVTPINMHSAPDVADYSRYSAPKAGFGEQAYCMRLWADKNDRTKVMLRNAAGDKAVSIEYSIRQLPFFTLWKNPAAHEDGYVTGLEPGTGFPRNRAIERKFGRVPKLAPHQSRSFTIGFAFHAGKDQVNAAADEIARIWGGRKTQIDATPLPSTKTSLSNVIGAARTWGPAFAPWHGKPAPDFALTDITGKEHKLSDYRGRNVLIVFWATWCRPCHMEIPHLIELRETVGEDDLAMLAISNERPDLVRGFVAQARINYTSLIDRGSLPGPYNAVRAIPSSFFIDPAGRIKLATSGLISLREIKAILEAE